MYVVKKEIVLLFAAIALLVSSCRQDVKPPVSVIFDTDLGPDYDDVGALTVLHALADQGEARILATVASNRYPLTSICIDAINHYYGRPELPIGAPLAGTVQEDGHAEKWTEALAAHFPHRIHSMDDVPDAAPIYRRLLAAEPDSSVVVVTVGFFTNLVALMQSPPDHYSPLNGKELIARKVKKLVSMAGKFPEGREYNVYVDTLASAAVFEQWPIPITFSGFEIGEKILTGKRLIASNIQNTPAKETFTICLRQDNPEGRESWDQTAVLVAVRGADRYFNTVKGQIKMEANGANSWQDDPNGNHEYLTWKMPVEELTKEIEDLMMHEKAPLVIKAPNHYPQPEIAWRHKYHQTLTMKLFLSDVDAVKENVKTDGKSITLALRKEEALLIVPAGTLAVSAQKVVCQVHPETGAIRHLAIEGDTRNMNWMLETDGSQYRWIKEEYGWGLGGFSIVSGRDTVKQQWKNAARVEQIADRVSSFYTVGDIYISVSRFHDKEDLIEEYRFSNKGKQKVNLTDIGINTPFNDNYPDAATCYRARTNAHIWEGENAAYVNAIHMSGKGPHLGLVVTKGSVKSYEIKERDIKKAVSNTRGVIVLNPEDITLKPEENYTLSWRIFSHQGHADFFAKALTAGSIIARSEKYVYQTGETAQIVFESRRSLKNPGVSVNGKTIPVTKTGNLYTVSVPITQTGDIRVELTYDGGKKTHVSCLGISGEDELMRKRAEFILAHQQLNDVNNKRYGAYMVYDNEENRIYPNDKPSVSNADRDEGAERLGMGIFLALYYQKTKDGKVKESLLKYVDFVRNQLQDKDYNTWSTVGHQTRNRAYNYPWVAHFYFLMFQITGNRQFLLDGYGTLKTMYMHFGRGFYCVGTPVQLGVTLLRENQMETKAASLLADFKETGDIFLKNGVNYPPHEVNYEQGIVAPAIGTLIELYSVTGEKRYLDGAILQLPLLEAFSGYQPNYHLNDIAIRHWDGYWFGKRETWGDVMPHYWSTLSAVAYNLYARSTGDASYQKRAESIVRNNLCNFFEDGKASCAYLYPYKVNGVKTHFYDPYANDQDWALAHYLIVHDLK